MSDFGTMQDRIEDEILDTSLNSNVQNAIQDAIRHYKANRFWFNEGTTTFSTVSGTEYYNLPTDYLLIDSMTSDAGGGTYTIHPKTFQWIDEIALANTSVGWPDYYAIYKNQIRLWPVPNGAYTLTVAGVRELDALSDDADTNEWMQDGEELIRGRALYLLWSNVKNDENRAAVAKRLEAEALARLKRESARRKGPRRMRYWGFS